MPAESRVWALYLSAPFVRRRWTGCRMDVTELCRVVTAAALARVAPDEAADPDVVGVVLAEVEGRAGRLCGGPGSLLEAGGAMWVAPGSASSPRCCCRMSRWRRS